MLLDIVLDTNVLLHATNEQEPRRVQSQALLLALRDCTAHLCVDEGFDWNEASNRSQIGGEYLKHLRAGTLGYAVVEHLARSLRVKQVSRGVPQNVSRHIRRVGYGPDRTYVRVAFNSSDRVLASHDFKDLSAGVRLGLRAAIGVRVLEAGEALVALRAKA